MMTTSHRRSLARRRSTAPPTPRGGTEVEEPALLRLAHFHKLDMLLQSTTDTNRHQ